MRRAAAVLVLFLALVVAAAPPAGAQVADAVTAFRNGDPVFVHPQAEFRISERDASVLRERIKKGDRSIFVAVLPASAANEAGGDPNRMPEIVYDKLGFAGTYAIVTGNSFRAGSTDLRSGLAGQIATNVFREHRTDGVGAVLLAFVNEVESVRGGSSGNGSGGRSGSSSGLRTFMILLFLGVVVFALWSSVRRRRRRNELLRSAESSREMLRADLAVLANDVMALEPQVTLHPDARDEYEEAVARFRFASEAIDKVVEPDDFDRIERVVAEGHYAMARAKAVIDGREPPPPPPELQAPGKHDEPPVVVRDGRPMYGGVDSGWYGGGWFGGGGGLLTGILIGDMLSGPRWGGGGWGGGHGGHGGGGEGGGGGDFGGGGGGDF